MKIDSYHNNGLDALVSKEYGNIKKRYIDPRLTANTIKNHPRATAKEKACAERFLKGEFDNKGVIRSIANRIERRG